FYSALSTLPNLTELTLKSCQLCDRLDFSIEAQFLQNIASRGIRRCGLVRSMRYDPDEYH
ncbi:unnamed protein product, partial [Thelazia callipaeda]|uniref:Mitochondrial ATP synthase regulatory component factor B n=1 Tax=Thelazia callipaeda TaxID=103827 RepID=A0A0N5CTK8_THECL